MEGTIIFNIDVMLAIRKMSVSELAEETGFTREAIRELMRLSGYQIEYIKEED